KDTLLTDPDPGRVTPPVSNPAGTHEGAPSDRLDLTRGSTHSSASHLLERTDRRGCAASGPRKDDAATGLSAQVERRGGAGPVRSLLGAKRLCQNLLKPWENRPNLRFWQSL